MPAESIGIQNLQRTMIGRERSLIQIDQHDEEIAREPPDVLHHGTHWRRIAPDLPMP